MSLFNYRTYIREIQVHFLIKIDSIDKCKLTDVKCTERKK